MAGIHIKTHPIHLGPGATAEVEADTSVISTTVGMDTQHRSR